MLVGTPLTNQLPGSSDQLAYVTPSTFWNQTETLRPHSLLKPTGGPRDMLAHPIECRQVQRRQTAPKDEVAVIAHPR